uniref:Ribosomal protein S20 n=1 Tax=Nitzschia sp. IriIs04 TaxID=1444690 RepID=A0A0S3QPK8_9STRA|nr:ribosomal protein S20 [Nitzschia sp. IriIs04]BAT70263.1 ribosomal protein S20 [Nitzschia sp. IriIs04]
MKKSILLNNKKKLNNYYYLKNLKILQKKFNILLKNYKQNKSSEDKSRLLVNLNYLYSFLDKSVKKNLLKKNKASKKKAFFIKKLKTI